MTDLKQAKERIELEITELGKSIEFHKGAIKLQKIQLRVTYSRLKKIDKLIEEANKVME